ncbi:uncharacterized protein N7496_006733 [Penicillium cataractarum]|uniref:Autophagy-related protein 1 n=1 Tax=Penicillium cataractarum TaxID=2100454 RepID=A0A9W9S273_9EURO|nr:uncharacterized protein N7496_006733 [Penicillium cataractarum]KAJ5370641.1 hypothetical protein N7496_006733 [Penicillium cataractarum]
MLIPKYETPSCWKGAFCFAAQDLVNPQSEIAQRYPHLYQVFRARLGSAYAVRNNRPVSLCSHTTFHHGYKGCRSDGDVFQKREWPNAYDRADPVRNATGNRMKHMCSELKDRMDVYGLAGEGTFGSVFLARERDNDNNKPENLQHYAVKVQGHETLLGALQANHCDPPNGPVPENQESLRYIPEEAMIMLFLSESDRFPTLDSVYTHDRFQAIVMSPCVDYNSDRQPSPPGNFSRRFPGFTARYLLTKDHRPLLNADEGRKIATQLFQAMRQLADMNAWHNDISVNNILVDKNLNAQMIDLGDIAFGLDERAFFERNYAYVPFQEYQLSPELAQQITTRFGMSVYADVTHDLRHEVMWKFATIIYGILHGFWPWNEPPKNGDAHPELLDARVFTDPQQILPRRYRIINDPLPIDENLPQDCKDVLQAMFSKNPEDRPTLAELEGYPWFSQWARETQFYERPFSRDFRHACTRRSK